MEAQGRTGGSVAFIFPTTKQEKKSIKAISHFFFMMPPHNDEFVQSCRQPADLSASALPDA